jgi:hypothetical protein
MLQLAPPSSRRLLSRLVSAGALALALGCGLAGCGIKGAPRPPVPSAAPPAPQAAPEQQPGGEPAAEPGRPPAADTTAPGEVAPRGPFPPMPPPDAGTADAGTDAGT